MRICIVSCLVLLCLAAGPAPAQNPQDSRKAASRLDTIQFKSECEVKKRMPNTATGPNYGIPYGSIDCHCAATVYERYVKQELARFDDLIKHYEDKLREEPERSETYYRAIDRQRELRRQFLAD